MAASALSRLLPTADADILEYLTATVDTALEDGDDLAEALGDLLISYELCEDEDAATALCGQLSAELKSSAAPVAAAATPSTLLQKPLQMGSFEADGAAPDLTPLLGRATTDALGNAVSMAARANAAAAQKNTTADDAPEDDAPETAHFGLLQQSAATAAERARREAAEREAAARAREAACELYLASKAGGGSRDVSLKSILLLSPGGKALLEEGAALKLAEGRRYGLVGRNGTGKSTLLRAISSFDLVGFPRHLKVVHVEQEMSHDPDATAIGTVLASDLERRVLKRRVAELSAAVAEDEAAAAGSDEKESAPARARRKRLAEAEALLDELGADDAEARGHKILDGLGFTAEMRAAPLSKLSGGWKMRVALAAALYVPCDVLLLDEPTNHLDFPALAWLTRWLRGCTCTVLVVSHDRGFLDDVVTDVIELRGKTLSYYKGDVSNFVRVLAERRVAQKRAFDAQQEKRKALQEDIDRHDPSKHTREENKKAKRTAAAVAHSKQSRAQLAKREEEGLVTDPDADVDEATISLSFPPPPPLKHTSLVGLRDVAFGYPGGAPLLEGVGLGVSLGSKVGVLGANGAGKSTLLKLMTAELTPTAGDATLSRACKWALFAQHHVDQLDLQQTATEYLSATFNGATDAECRGRLARFGIVEWMSWLQMSKLSGGQKSRVLLCAICWAAPALLFLDEPTNHLDMETVDVLAAAIAEFSGAVVVVSHDVYFLEQLKATEFWSVKERRVSRFHTLDEATHHAKAE